MIIFKSITLVFIISFIFKSLPSSVLIWRVNNLVYLFPRATVISYHKFGNLKQQKFLLSWFWRANIQTEKGHISSRGSKKDLIPCFFQLLAAIGIPFLRSTNVCLRSQLPIALLSVLLCVSLTKFLSLDLGHVQIIQDDLIPRSST